MLTKLFINIVNTINYTIIQFSTRSVKRSERSDSGDVGAAYPNILHFILIKNFNKINQK